MRTTLSGQVNLVPNPSFELIDTCPYMQDQLAFASPWFQPNPGSSDLYNRCSSVIVNTVPQNWTGYQQPRTGDGYAGIAAYNYTYNGLDNRREYLTVQLTDTLKFGKLYCVEFYASRADSSYWAINRLGLHLSAQAIIDNLAIDTLTATPQIQYDTATIFTDTMNWVRIHGTYRANGNEQFITIGNFYADDQTDTIAQPNSWMWAYFYIDDVAIYELEEVNAGNDVSICYLDSASIGTTPQANVMYLWSPSTGLSDDGIANPMCSPSETTTYILSQFECGAVNYDTVTVTVNKDCHSASSIIIPSLLYNDQFLFITGLESDSRVELFDVRGRLIFAADDYQNDMFAYTLTEAMYVCILTRPNGEHIVQKIIVVR